MKPRFYTSNEGPTERNESIAWEKAIDLSRGIGGIDEITILIHTKRNTGYIDRVFGREFIDRLFRGAVIAYEGGPRVKLETLKTYDSTIYSVRNYKRILLSYGLDSKELFHYDHDVTISAIVAHQWQVGGVKSWAEAWGAVDLLSGEQANSEEDALDAVVKEAFTSLTKVINLTTGIANHYDNNRCKTYLRALHTYKYKLDPEGIRKLLITELGWQGKHVEEVIKLVNTLNEGRYFQGGEKNGLQQYIKNWKSRI